MQSELKPSTESSKIYRWNCIRGVEGNLFAKGSGLLLQKRSYVTKGIKDNNDDMEIIVKDNKEGVIAEIDYYENKDTGDGNVLPINNTPTLTPTPTPRLKDGGALATNHKTLGTPFLKAQSAEAACSVVECSADGG